MKRLTILALALLIGSGLLFNGCGSSTQIKQASQTTLGQELIDLDKAHKEGIISTDEYNRLKKEVIKKYSD